ncbi:MAG: DUF1624 domain-containing protein [Thermoanaerobaculia bacterium]
MRRLPSLDIVRGAVMVLMAIDHVRVYAGVPAGDPDPAVFFTRWITHFCAPVFVFLAGTAAYLYRQKIQSRAALAKFLAIRGLWLVLLEVTVLRFAWTFNFDYANFTFAGVIWVIVPFFYYVLHIPLIHLVAVLISLVRTPEHTGWLFANHPMLSPDVPPGYRWSLALLYLVTALVVIALYFPCRSYARVKAERPRAWMKYV